MPSEVRHLVDTGQTYPVVRFTGVLDADSAPAVRSVLLDVMASQPEAVVADLSELRLGDPDAVRVFREVAEMITEWPSAHLVLTAPEPDRWHAAGLPVWPTPAAAFAEMGDPDAAAFLSVTLDPVVGAARRSRQLVTEACGRWDLPGLAGPACIVVTEMVNNVVAHAHTPMSVLLARHGDAMSVAVRDDSPTIPRFTGPVSPTSYGGRGLLLIDSVAERWGSLELDAGKVVWAVLEPDDENRAVGRAGMADPARG